MPYMLSFSPSSPSPFSLSLSLSPICLDTDMTKMPENVGNACIEERQKKKGKKDPRMWMVLAG